MNSEKMLYWVTLVVMTVLVGNHFAMKYQGTSVAGDAMATVQHLGAEATHFVATAQPSFNGVPSFAASEAKLASMQGQFASLEASMARRQAACAREQARQAHMMALRQVQHLRIVCPRQSITVNLPRIPAFISE